MPKSFALNQLFWVGSTKVKKYAISILAGLALGVLSFGAIADPIGPDCPNQTCFGNIYALFFTDGTSTGTDNGDGTTTYDISLAINTAGYSNGPDLTGFLYAVGTPCISAELPTAARTTPTASSAPTVKAFRSRTASINGTSS
jgi:hypothetical protein